MMKPNYAFAKRQRDLAKKAKNAEKLARKRGQTTKTETGPEPAPESVPTQQPPA